MKCARHNQLFCHAGTLGRCKFNGFFYSGNVTGKNYLSGRVEISRLNDSFPAGFSKQAIESIIGHTDNCGHGSGVLYSGILHEIATLCHNTQGIIKSDSSGKAECSVLSEAVSGSHGYICAADKCCYSYTVQKYSRLGIFRLTQLLFAARKHNIGY